MASSELTIRHLGPKGDGISLGPRGPIYVERALPGDRLTARIQRDDEGVSRADILKLLQPSPHRQKAPCPHYDRCGGCTLQHLNARYYRDWKVALVRDALAKQGLRPRRWKEPVFLEGPTRRRAVFSAKKQRGQITLGYYRRRSQDITEIDSCLIADPRLLVLRESLKPFLNGLLAEGPAVDVFFQWVADTCDVVWTGPVGKKGVPDASVRQALVEWAKVSGVARVSWRGHEREASVTLVDRSQVIAHFAALRVVLPPSAFLQPTLAGEFALVDAVTAALPSNGKFADLFSGCGTFSGPLLQRGPVDAYEASLPSVKALTAAGAGTALKVFGRDLFARPLKREEANRYDALVFDPPRVGCREQAAALASARTATLVGVSCNPATFARDARILCGGGYRLQSVQIIDQFQWSHHVEVVGAFSR